MEIIAGKTTYYGSTLRPCPKCKSTQLRGTESAGQVGSVVCVECGYAPYLCAKGRAQADGWNERAEKDSALYRSEEETRAYNALVKKIKQARDVYEGLQQEHTKLTGKRLC